MDGAKLVVGILLAASITFFAWVWLVDISFCDPCSGKKEVYSSSNCEVRFVGLKDGMPKFAEVCP